MYATSIAQNVRVIGLALILVILCKVEVIRMQDQEFGFVVRGKHVDAQIHCLNRNNEAIKS